MDKETIFEDKEKLKELAQKITINNDKIYQYFGNWLVWRYAQRKKNWKFAHLPPEEKVNLLDDERMNVFVSDFEKEINEFIEIIKKEYIF